MKENLTFRWCLINMEYVELFVSLELNAIFFLLDSRIVLLAKLNFSLP